MAENQAFNQQSVKAAEDLLVELKSKAKAAQDANDVFLFGILNDLIRATSPIVTRAINRLHRTENAKINAAHKALRAKFREDAEKSTATNRPHLTRE